MPGVLAIVIFGLGNIIAAVFSFKKGITVSGMHLLLWELFSFFALCFIQLCLSGYVFFGYRKGL